MTDSSAGGRAGVTLTALAAPFKEPAGGQGKPGAGKHGRKGKRNTKDSNDNNNHNNSNSNNRGGKSGRGSRSNRRANRQRQRWKQGRKTQPKGDAQQTAGTGGAAGGDKKPTVAVVSTPWKVAQPSVTVSTLQPDSPHTPTPAAGAAPSRQASSLPGTPTEPTTRRPPRALFPAPPTLGNPSTGKPTTSVSQPNSPGVRHGTSPVPRAMKPLLPRLLFEDTVSDRSKLPPLQPQQGRDTSTADGVSSVVSKLRVVQYNVLADEYALQSMFPYVRLQQLRWEVRGPRLLRELLAYNADIICLQEVDHYHDFFAPQLAAFGYAGAFQKRPHYKQDGCAIFYKRKHFKLTDRFALNFNELVTDFLALKDKATAKGDKAVRDLLTPVPPQPGRDSFRRPSSRLPTPVSSPCVTPSLSPPDSPPAASLGPSVLTSRRQVRSADSDVDGGHSSSGSDVDDTRVPSPQSTQPAVLSSSNSESSRSLPETPSRAADADDNATSAHSQPSLKPLPSGDAPGHSPSITPLKGPFKGTPFVFDVSRTNNIAFGALLRCRHTGSAIWVVNTHLYWNPQYPHIKLAQTQVLKDYIAQLHAEHPDRGIILCGDLNSKPDSHVYKWLTTPSARLPLSLRPSDSNIPSGKTNGSDTKTSDTNSPPLSSVSPHNSAVSVDVDQLSVASSNSHSSVPDIAEEDEDVDDDDDDDDDDIKTSPRTALQGPVPALPYKPTSPTHLSGGSMSPKGSPPSTSPLVDLRSIHYYQREEPAHTNFTAQFKGTLDYVFYTPHNVAPICALTIPDYEQLAHEVALPNSSYPSDHLALVADFQWKQVAHEPSQCPRGVVCRDMLCPNQHAVLCEDGLECSKDSCKLAHVEACKFGLACKTNKCPFNHLPCRKGAHGLPCSNTGGSCVYSHLVCCRWGTQCKRADCNYHHPPSAHASSQYGSAHKGHRGKGKHGAAAGPHGKRHSHQGPSHSGRRKQNSPHNNRPPDARVSARQHNGRRHQQYSRYSTSPNGNAPLLASHHAHPHPPIPTASHPSAHGYPRTMLYTRMALSPYRQAHQPQNAQSANLSLNRPHSSGYHRLHGGRGYPAHRPLQSQYGRRNSGPSVYPS